MLVYGDRTRSEDPRRSLDAIRASIAGAAAAPPGVVRHDQLVAALIEAGVLAQGLADAEMARSGCDRRSAIQAAAMGLVVALARQVGASWTAGFRRDAEPPESGIDALEALALPDRIEARQPEGYAFYALYPETYFAAAEGLSADACVIGLRSIGTSLAAMVAAGAGAKTLPVSLRPVGHPFRRRVDLDAALLDEIGRDPSAVRAVVDEGPGLSGSSFGATADALETRGVPPDRIVFFPGHAGDPGPEAEPAHARRWSAADRRVVSFDDLILPRLAAAVEDLTGPAAEPMEDLSGGRWRALACAGEAAWPPVNAMQERRKFRLRTASGLWLLKFAGLGRIGRAVLDDAERLHAAGFCPQPAGLRLGFLVQRWEAPAVPLRSADLDRAEDLDTLGRYLSFRATLTAPDQQGADLAGLAEMTSTNIAEALGETAAAVWHRRYGRLDRLAPPRRVRTDNRLHAWEWLRLPDGRLLKADAGDHCRAHDLIGCQDIAWDLAGAQIEFDVSRTDLDRLAGAVAAAARIPVDPMLLEWLAPAYLAFQIGSWTMAAARSDAAERLRIRSLLDRYRIKLAALLDGADHP